MEEEKVTIEDIKSLEISETTKEDLSVRSLSNTPSAHSSQYGQKGLTAAEIRAKYSALPEHIVEKFNALIKALSNLIPAIAAHGVKSVSFTHDGKTVITREDDSTTEFDGSWLTDISNGGNVPPTAKAVKKYADDKETELKGKAIGIPEFDETTGVVKFSSIDGKSAKEINLLLESEFDSGYYDADTEELVIKFKSGNELRLPASALLCPTWVSDMDKMSDEQKATPPTAEAVKSYVDDKTTFNKTYDAGKFVIVGNDGSLTTSNVGKYRHNVNVKSYEGSKLNVDVYAVVYTNSPDVMSWSDIFYELLAPTMMGDAYPCQGFANYGKSDAISLSYSETPNSDGGYDECVHIKYRTNNGIETQTLYISECTFEDRIADYDIGVIKESISENKSDIEDISRRVDNLEDVLVEEKEVTSDKYVTPVPANVGRRALLNEVGGMTYKCRNLAKIYGFSAGDMKTPSSDRLSSNQYGTTISTTEPANSITVTQSTFNEDEPYYAHYTNGYFLIGIEQDLQDGEEITFSCDVKVTDNLSGRTDMVVKPNTDKEYRVDISSGRIVLKGLWHVSGERKCIEIRLNAISAVFSNFMLERGHTDGKYEPYFSGLRSAKVTAVESRGKNLYNKVAIEEKGYICSDEGTLKENSGYKSVFIDVRGLDSITVSNNTPNNYGVFACVLNSKEIGSVSKGGRLEVYNQGKTIQLNSSDYEAKYVCISIWGASFETVAPYIQVEAGDTATEHTPYREPITYTLPEAITSRGEFGLGVTDVHQERGSFSNTIDFDNKKFYYNRVQKFELTGMEGWTVHTGEHPNTYKLFRVEKTMCCISNHYTALSVREYYDNASKDGIYGYSVGGFYVRDNSATSLEEFKAKLAEWAANGEPLTVICGFDDDTAEDIYINEDDNVIEVEPGGSLVAVNEYGLNAPTKVSYIVAKGGNA